ncbi:MAG: type II secretion system F family protein [Oceanospirillaceae bacterium]|nr:type II secretion system F family protein [Oceanospirillaceae bacterium]
MMKTLADLATDTLFWLSLAAVFSCVAIIGWLLVRRANVFMKDYQSVFKETATGNLEDMYLFIDPQQLFIANIVALLLVPILAYLFTGNFSIALLVIAVLIVIPFMAYKSMRKKRLKKFEQQLPDVLVMISGALASGSSLNMALQSVMLEQQAPISQEFMLFVREQRIGVDFDTSLRNMERRIPLLDFSMFSAAMRISREVGGDLGEVLSTLADTLRRKSSMEGKIDALTAQGRMQGIVMTGLPILLGGLLFTLEPEAMSKLFTTPMGWGLLSVIVVMEVLGYIFISKITSIDV